MSKRLKWLLRIALLLALIGAPAGCTPQNNGGTMQKKPVKIMLGGGRVEDSWYALAQAAASFVNKKSDWLKVEVVATAGLSANIELVNENPHEYMGILPLSTTLQYRPGCEFSDDRGAYEGARFIANSTSMTQLIVTHDAAIKTVSDLKGKTIGIAREGSGNIYDHLAIFERYGVLDKVKLIHGGFGGNIDKLVDGLADATITMIDHIYPNIFMRGVNVEQASIRGPVNFVGFDETILKEVRDAGHATVPVRIPGGTLDPERQPDDLWAFVDPTYFGADARMDQDVIYEFTRIIFETPETEWETWHPQGAHMTAAIKPANPVPKLLPVHEGAKRYFTENNIAMKDLAELLR